MDTGPTASVAAGTTAGGTETVCLMGRAAKYTGTARSMKV